jgi:predicted transposase YbfD/YdcC
VKNNPIAEGSTRRIAKHMKFNFSELRDPRQQNLIKFSLGALLSLVIAGFAAQQSTLRMIERFYWYLRRPAQRHLGFGTKRAPCDTTIYNLLLRLDPTGLRHTLVQMVKKAVKQRAVTNDLFPGGIAAIDGKGGIEDWGSAPNEQAKQTICDADMTPVWYLFSQRVHLVSSSVCPCLDQEFLDNKSGEPRSFPTVLERIVANYPGLFEIVTGDAIYPSRANAQATLGHDKDYIFGLKKNQHRLWDLALVTLNDISSEAETFERYQGKDTSRVLFCAPCPPDVDFPGAKQFIAVVQTTFDDKHDEVIVDGRLFITSIASERFSAKALLKAVRLHWGIENNGNWTMDERFDDDVRCPCKQGNGAVVVTWLRLLAFNIVAIVRSLAPKHDKGTPPGWSEIKNDIMFIFVRWEEMRANNV